MRAPRFWRQSPEARSCASAGVVAGVAGRALSGAASTALLPLGALYSAAGWLRQHTVKPVRVSVPVVCIGNLTTGGAGKTPTALAVADRLSRKGLRPHLLLRGYKGRLRGPALVDPIGHDATAVGDEALLLARRFPTWVSRDRVAGARAAIEAGANVIVMDDGFQNPTLVKDLSLIVVDGGYGFGNGRVIPAGPLREPLARGLARAQAVVVVGTDNTDVARSVARRLPVLRAIVVPGPEAAKIAGERVFAFAGIGRPEKFFDTLEEIGCTLVDRQGFPDHHTFQPREIVGMVEAAQRLDAHAVTTEKDLVRLPAEAREMVEHLSISLEWLDATLLDEVLAPVYAATKRPKIRHADREARR